MTFRWIQNINGGPGFSEQGLAALRSKHIEQPSDYTLCTLVIDGMAIRSHTEWDPDKETMVGFVNLGIENASDEQDIATEALVFMAFGLLGHWKIAFAYFLVAGVSADLQKSLVKQAIIELHSVGLKVVALTLDGLAINQS